MTIETRIIGSTRVLYVMAVDAEYGAHLRTRIAPLMTGVGPVEAAVVLTRALAGLEASGHLPDLVVSLGSAGSATLEQTGVYQASSLSYRDMDASAFGFEKGVTPFLDLPATVPLPIRIPDVPAARLSTGANVVSGAAYAAIDADMVDMESFAVLRACQAFGVALIGLRGISDGKAEVKHVGDWTEYLHVIDEKLAAVVDRIEAALATDTLPGFSA
ncbi:adenosylhomocysteine nucleosidase [Rhizobium sp. RU20A]|uniref:5'-methylthioadenosine/S-adenosylhomocysteine nucleosidase n=1 Tax=Rhizobium sp. RU20A TaxID=1907412 RepID=UPI00095548EE|nr:5'-methylthioadenosine/S-adenosylhomocysteine nucleosidase [Rhizobium sp. RU20A]SIQ73345.1 adenosylhomocysteine nucleosidase [Rhizobium sp. RU20A]